MSNTLKKDTYPRIATIQPEYYMESSIDGNKVIYCYRKHINTYDRLVTVFGFAAGFTIILGVILIILGVQQGIKVSTPAYSSSYMQVPQASGFIPNIMFYLGIFAVLLGLSCIVFAVVFSALKDKAMWEQYEWEYFKANFIDPMANRRTQQQQNRPQGASSHEDKQE